MDFSPVVVFEKWGITNTITISWGIMAFLVIGSYLLTRGIRNAPVDKAPTGRFAVAEMIVEGITSLVDSSMGKGKRGFVPYIGALTLYLAVANLVGLIGIKPPTSDLNTTLGLAFITFVMIQYHGFKSQGLLKRLKSFTEPLIIMTPINIFGEFTSPMSMAFRLFGNIFGGMVIMGLIYWLLPIPLVIPIVGHLYFDLFSGLIQTFVFVMLTATFVSTSMD